MISPTRKSLLPAAALAIFFWTATPSISAEGKAPTKPTSDLTAFKATSLTPGEQVADEPADPAALAFGEVVFDYYNGRSLPAATNLLLARRHGALTERDDYAELLLGELYTSFGLSEAAEKTFAGLVQRDILPKIRNETWFRTAELHYRQGRFDNAARILEGQISALPFDLEQSRLVMLGNIYLRRGDLQPAANILSRVRTDHVMGAYALYNTGVALLRTDQDTERGMAMLQQARNLSAFNEEANALKDRAAIAMGFVWLQKGEFDKAREALLSVRASGPYSNQAILGLGYANFQRKDYTRALPPLIELSGRNPSDTTVQEALLLAPLAFEELNAEAQALQAYEKAASILKGEQQKIEKAIIRVREPEWLESLSPDSQDALSDKAFVAVNPQTSTRAPEAAYLYSLFASREFSDEYASFLELKRLDVIIEHWLQQIAIFQEMLETHRAKLKPLQPRLSDVLARGNTRIPQLRGDLDSANRKVASALDSADATQTAQTIHLNRLEKILALKVVAQGNTATLERLRRMEGLILWDIVHASPDQQQQSMADLSAISRDIELAAIRLDSLERLQDDLAGRANGDLGQRLSSASTRLGVLKMETSARLRQQATVLQNRALTVLTEIRRNIGAQVSEAQLSMARLQDPGARPVKRGDTP